MQAVNKALKGVRVHQMETRVAGIFPRVLRQLSLPAQGGHGLMKLDALPGAAVVRGELLLEIAEGSIEGHTITPKRLINAHIKT